MNIRKIIIVGYILFMFFTSVQAQDTLDFPTVEDSSYSLYLEGNWRSLIALGKEAFKDGIDYYYLRIRLGIAYHNIGKYIQAAGHLNEALKYNRTDPLALEYLYYSYRNLNRHYDARIIFNRLPALIQEQIEDAGKGLENHFVYYGFEAMLNPDVEIDKGESLVDSAYTYAQKKIPDYNLYTNISIRHSVTDVFTFYYAYSKTILNAIHQVQYWYEEDLEMKNRIEQDQFYLSLNCHLWQGADIRAAVHYLSIEKEGSYFNLDSFNIPYAYETVENFNDAVYFLSLGKYFFRCKFDLQASYSDLNRHTQVQLGGNLLTYPLGNLNLYTISKFVVHLDKDTLDSSEYKQRLIFDQTVGFKIFKHLWLEACYTAGEMKNFNEDYGFVVYNSANIMKHDVGGTIIVPVLKNRLLFYGIYHYYLYENQNVRYQDVFNRKNITASYPNHLIYGGIKWNF